MDFESLLRRYMRHVIDEEGTPFTSVLRSEFTEAEAEYLKSLGDVLYDEAHPPRPPGPLIPPPTPEEQQRSIQKMADSAMKAFQQPNAFMQEMQSAQSRIAAQMQPKLEAEQQEWLNNFRVGSPLLARD